jgi:hypothetical protein
MSASKRRRELPGKPPSFWRTGKSGKNLYSFVRVYVFLLPSASTSPFCVIAAANFLFVFVRRFQPKFVLQYSHPMAVTKACLTITLADAGSKERWTCISALLRRLFSCTGSRSLKASCSFRSSTKRNGARSPSDGRMRVPANFSEP